MSDEFEASPVLDEVIFRVLDGSGSESDYAMVAARVHSLARSLSRSGADADEAASVVLERLVQRSRRSRRDQVSSAALINYPYAFLRTMVKNAIADQWRQTFRTAALTDPDDLITQQDASVVGKPLSSDDDAIVRLIDTAASIQLVQAALRLARTKGDSTAFRVAVSFMNRAAEQGRPPSNRAIAEDLKLSHVGVAKALTRYREYLLQVGLMPEDV
jgi:DNA-directed RNA polymerase specialized sigma24 family protein